MKPSPPSPPQLAPLYLCKLSNVLSEQAFLAHLQTFTHNKEKRIMLLVSQLFGALDKESLLLCGYPIVIPFLCAHR